MPRPCCSRPVTALVLALTLAACAGEAAEPPREVASTSAAPPGPTQLSASPPAPPAEPTSSVRVIDVRYTQGTVSGVPSRVPVALGEQVVLRVTSDVAEEIHVHGYDRHADLVPGRTVEIAFVADLPGAYEVELHHAGRPLFQLRVS